jgi:hypothetical protein
MDAIRFIKGMKNFMSLLEYCESHNLIEEDEEVFVYDDNGFDSIFTELWTRKLRFVLSPYTNISFLRSHDRSFNLKIESEKEEYIISFTYTFGDEECDSIFFAQTDVLIVHSIGYSTPEKFKTLIENESPHVIETIGQGVFLKIDRETCFEKIIEVIEKLKTIN